MALERLAAGRTEVEESLAAATGPIPQLGRREAGESRLQKPPAAGRRGGIVHKCGIVLPRFLQSFSKGEIALQLRQLARCNQKPVEKLPA
jgi:hypothetical protein